MMTDAASGPTIPVRAGLSVCSLICAFMCNAFSNVQSLGELRYALFRWQRALKALHKDKYRSALPGALVHQAVR